MKHSAGNLNFDQVTNLSKTVQINNNAVRNIYRSPNNSIQHPVLMKNLKGNAKSINATKQSKKEGRFNMTDKNVNVINKNKKFMFTMQPYLRYEQKPSNLNLTPNNHINKKYINDHKTKNKNKHEI